MAETPEGHVESVSVEETTLAGNLGGGTEGGTAAPPHVGVEQLRAQKREIDKPDNILFGSTWRSIERSNATETVGAHASWPVM